MPLISPQLKEIMACPCPHHAELAEDEAASALRCQKCRLAFEVEDGLPIMLLEDALAGPDFDPQECGAPELVKSATPDAAPKPGE